MLFKVVIFGLLFSALVLDLDADLIEVDETNKREKAKTGDFELYQGPSNINNDVIDIVGPRNPYIPGKPIAKPKDKVIDDAWKAVFFNPQNSNNFGLTPRPQDVFDLSKRPGENRAPENGQPNYHPDNFPNRQSSGQTQGQKFPVNNGGNEQVHQNIQTNNSPNGQRYPGNVNFNGQTYPNQGNGPSNVQQYPNQSNGPSNVQQYPNNGVNRPIQNHPNVGNEQRYPVNNGGNNQRYPVNNGGPVQTYPNNQPNYPSYPSNGESYPGNGGYDYNPGYQGNNVHYEPTRPSGQMSNSFNNDQYSGNGGNFQSQGSYEQPSDNSFDHQNSLGGTISAGAEWNKHFSWGSGNNNGEYGGGGGGSIVGNIIEGKKQILNKVVQTGKGLVETGLGSLGINLNLNGGSGLSILG